MKIQVIENGFTVNKYDYPNYAVYCSTLEEVLEHVKNCLAPTNIGTLSTVSAAEAGADQERIYKLANEGKI